MASFLGQKRCSIDELFGGDVVPMLQNRPGVQNQ